MPEQDLGSRNPRPKGTSKRSLILGLFSLVLGCVAFAVAPSFWTLPLRIVFGWDALAAAWLLPTWWFLFRADAEATRVRAAVFDPGRTMVFLIAIGAAMVSVFVVAEILLSHRNGATVHEPFWPSILGLVSSWSVTHTAFGLRYAHLEYRDDDDRAALNFPGTEMPTEADFAYFSFTIGMCFQVSDVSIQSSDVRRVVLAHSLLSYAYNTILFALTVNFAVNLLS